jgi:putative N6-adenine-specific DNA methylase
MTPLRARGAGGPGCAAQVLAAGILKLTGWDPTTQHLVDPMCGSGTLPIEAAMAALDIAPGLLRPRFGFMSWRDFDPRLWARLRGDAAARARRELRGGARIVGADADRAAVDAARRNAGFLRANALRFAVRDFFDFQPPAADDALRTLMVLNPPYGRRLHARGAASGGGGGDGGEGGDKGLFQRIGDSLKQRFAGCQAWVIGPVGPGGVGELGLRPSRRVVLFNGAIECRLQRYDLYAGRAAAQAAAAAGSNGGGHNGPGWE